MARWAMAGLCAIVILMVLISVVSFGPVAVLLDALEAQP